MTGKPPRFALNETEAREWLKDQASDNYFGRLDIGGSETMLLVEQALAVGVMTDQLTPPCPSPSLAFLYEHDDGSGDGYRWLLEVADFTLCTEFNDMRHLGDAEAAEGIPQAISVLREAESAGNELARKLAAYTAGATS